jgi:hypothetical protein
MNTGREEVVLGYELRGLGISTYCKVKALGRGIGLFFGKGMRQFCITASYDDRKPDEIYLAQVNSDLDCIEGGRLVDLEKGAVRFIKLALYALKRWFPRVTTIRLMDDSKIKCQPIHISLSLPLDYMAKYGMTWYEKHFHAQIDDRDTMPDQIKLHYQKLKILDDPLTEPYEEVIQNIPGIVPYETLYREASTHRDFLNRVRKHLGDKYCEEGGKLLLLYMKKLHIQPISNWKIMMEDVETVPNYQYTPMNRNEAKKRLNGGRRKGTRGQSGFIYERDQYRSRRTHKNTHAFRKGGKWARYRLTTDEPDYTDYTMADYYLGG